MREHAMPRWYRPVFLALSALLLVGWFSRGISDPDFWWHLKTGQYVVEKHALPVPDPFAFTTGMGRPAYAGEERTRYFNLTHEWLAQAAMFSTWKVSGFPGLVLFRAALLAGFCGLAGLVAWRRCGGFYRSVGAAFAAGGIATAFASDRPFVITFFFLALTIAILEYRRALWILPPLLVVWANCHGGYFLGLVVLAAYSGEALWLRFRKGPQPGARTLWLVSGAAAVLSGLNPNGYRILEILGYYRNSFLTSRLLEWRPTPLWPPDWFTFLLAAGAVALIVARRSARPVDWLLFAAFSAAALSAQRNTILIGVIAPIVIASYLPVWKRPVPRAAPYAAGALVAALLMWGAARGKYFQFRVEAWKWPAGAADFLLAQRVGGRIFNTYEYGGYLIWRLWPANQVFIDGRALNEAVFRDYGRILYNREAGPEGEDARALLRRYGVDAIVMNGFEYTGGLTYLLAPALADPQQTEWKLVFDEPQAMVFLRNSPPGMTVLPSGRVFDHLEAECGLHIGREPQYPLCARALGQVFAKVRDYRRARRWLGTYLALPHSPDPVAEEAYRTYVGAGY